MQMFAENANEKLEGEDNIRLGSRRRKKKNLKVILEIVQWL